MNSFFKVKTSEETIEILKGFNPCSWESVDQRPEPGQVSDINSYTLSAFCAAAGAIPIHLGLCKDSFSDLRDMVAMDLEAADTLCISGGSSVGARDITVQALESFPGMELLMELAL